MKFSIMAWVMFAVSCVSKPGPQAVITRVSSPSANPAPRIAAFCVAQNGRRVGDGECWTLADSAFRSAGANRPGSDLRVWGRPVNPAAEGLKPGDVIEFRNASFSDGFRTGSAHTAVVVKGGSEESFLIAEQNWGKKSVRVRELNLTSLLGGKVMVYRPVG